MCIYMYKLAKLNSLNKCKLKFKKCKLIILVNYISLLKSMINEISIEVKNYIAWKYDYDIYVITKKYK